MRVMTWIRSWGLRERLVMTTLLTVLPIVCVVIVMLGSFSASLIRGAAESELSAAAQTTAKSIEQWDHYIVLALRNVRGQPDIINMVPADQLPVIMQMKKAYDQIEIVRVTGTDGNSTIRTDGNTPVSYADREWFQECIAGQPIYRQILVTKTSDKAAVNFSTPIHDSSGKIVGVLSAVTPLSSMEEILGLAHDDPSSVTFVVDGKGRALAHPNLHNANALIDISQDPPVKNAIEHGPAVLAFTDVHGCQWYSQRVQLSNGWFVISQVTVAHTMERSAGIMRISYWLAAITVLLVVVLTWIIGTRLLLPIRALTRAAGAMAGGNLHEQIDTQGRDEIATLGKSFLKMRDSIRETIGGLNREMTQRQLAQEQLAALNRTLEARVDERTRELSRSNQMQAAIQNASLDGILVLDCQWRILELNLAAARNFACRREDAIGRNLEEFVVPPASGGAEAFPTRGEKSVLNRRIEVIGRRRNGPAFPAELAITAAETSDPSVFVALLRDLTDRKKAETEKDELNRQLVSASRNAGMAEVAVGVLHNVGNVLNSVNISAKVVVDKLHHSEIENVARLGEMIQAHRDDLAGFLSGDERGRLVPGFMVELGQQLQQEQSTLVSEMNRLADGVEHIKMIITAQQSLAKKQSVVTSCEPGRLFETALTMQSGFVESDGIEIVRRFESVPALPLDQHRIVQILVNLIGNAKHAVRQGSAGDRRIVLAVRTTGDAAAPRLIFEVADNGVGIQREDLTRIFSHGFTTKRDGHGFGLHSSANAAREMEGSLSVASEGPGKGAVFTLDIPFSNIPAGKI